MKKRRYLPLITVLILLALMITACGAAVETTPAETTPVETTPVETTPVHTTPTDTAPTDTTPVGTPPCNHNFGSWRQTEAPDCVTEGSNRRICDLCGLVETKAVSALGHALISHESKAATCLHKGWDAYETCERCDYSTYREYMGDHKFLHSICYYCGLKEDGTAYVFGSFYDHRGNASHLGAPDLFTYSMSLYTPEERRLFCHETGSQAGERFYVHRESYVFSEVLQKVVLAEDARIFYTNNQQTEILSYMGVRYEYDDRGNITLEAAVDEAGNRLNYYEREYDGTSLVLERFVMDDVIVRESRYDGDFLTEETRREENGTYLYYKNCVKREDGTYVADYFDEAGVRIRREENTALGRVYRTEVYDGEGRVIQRIEEEESNHVYTYTYDWSTGESLLIQKIYKHSHGLSVHAYQQEDYEYEDGRLSRTLSRDEAGTLLGTMECGYDESGALTGEFYRDAEGNLVAEKTYDGEGRLLSHQVMGEENYTLSYSYYSSGAVHTEEKRDGEGMLLSVRTYEYTSDGKLASIMETDGEGNPVGKIQHYVTSEGELRIDILTYDGDGRVTRREITNELGGRISLYTYAYGADGEMTERVTTHEGKALHTHEYFEGGLLIKLEEVYPDGGVFTTAYYTYSEDGVLRTKQIYSSFDIMKEYVEYYPSGGVKVRETYSSTTGNHTGDTGYAEDGTELWRREYQYYGVLYSVTYTEYVTIGDAVYDALVRRQIYETDGVTLKSDITEHFVRREDGTLSASSQISNIDGYRQESVYDESERLHTYWSRSVREDGTLSEMLWEYRYTEAGEEQRLREEYTVSSPDGTPLSHQLTTYAYEPGKQIVDSQSATYEDGVLVDFERTEKTVRLDGGLLLRLVSYDSEDKILCTEEYTYNFAGHVAKIVRRDGEGNVVEETENLYSGSQLVSTVVKDGEGNVLRTDRYTHDVDIFGRTQRQSIVYEEGRVALWEECTYSRANHDQIYYHQRKVYGEDGRTIIDYIHVEREYTGRGKLSLEREKDISGTVLRERKITYENNTPATDVTVYYREDGKTVTARLTTYYVYDEVGYLLTELDRDGEDRVLRMKEYYYQPLDGYQVALGSLETHYDTDGNVTGTVEEQLTANEWPDLTIWRNADGTILRTVDVVYQMEDTEPIARIYTVDTRYDSEGNPLFIAVYDPTGKLLRVE